MSEPWWSMELEGKPDFEMAMKRVYAWYHQELLDRPPVRFSETNADFNRLHAASGRTWASLKERWFDAEYQVDSFVESVRGKRFYGETFPVFSPNLGPGVYAAFHGATLRYGEITSWSEPLVRSWDEMDKVRFDPQNEYFKKIEELTRLALEKCPGLFITGYTDLHGSVDCVADWRDPQQLCMDLITEPDKVLELIRIAVQNFQPVFDHFDAMIKAHGQPSVTWMGIPSFGKMHIPSCDFLTLVSPAMCDEYYLPVLREEVKAMSHNVFHLDGRGVAKNLDAILTVSEINAIQWVQGVGEDLPILQWLPLLKKIQAAGKSILVDLQLGELEAFIEAMDPKGVYLCLAADPDLQPEILKRLERW